MKNFKYLILFICIYSTFSCKKNEEKFTYDKTLVEIFSFELEGNLFDNSKKIEKLDTINFYYFNDRIEIVNYPISNKFLVDFFQKNINYSEKLFFYGSKTIEKNTLFLFSFEDKFFETPYRKLGFLAIKNKEKKKYTFIKVFKDEADSGEFYRSIYSNNYLLLLSSNDESYDVIDEAHTKVMNEDFCILKIMKTGNISVLNEKESKITLKKEFTRWSEQK